jgi:hypothetical protein
VGISSGIASGTCSDSTGSDTTSSPSDICYSSTFFTQSRTPNKTTSPGRAGL